MTENIKISSLGIVGTAKNTGKTTVLSAVLSEASENKKYFALTSIGYDGEAVDNLTLLPKPRLFVTENQIIATADKCVKWAEADLEILEKTGIDSGLGEIYITKVLKPGKVILAGPNKHKPLLKIINKLSEYTNKVIVDGALGRIAPFSIVDEIIFSTGAARNTNIDVLVQEMQSIYEIFNFNKIKSDSDKDKESIRIIETTPNISFLLNGKWEEWLQSSVLSEKDSQLIGEKIAADKPEKVFIPGAISSKPIQNLIANFKPQLSNLDIIFYSAPTILSGWDPIPLRKILTGLSNAGVKLFYLKKQDIKLITINPFYPKRIHRGAKYIPAYLNAEELKNTFKQNFNIPILDIFADGQKQIFSLM